MEPNREEELRERGVFDAHRFHRVHRVHRVACSSLAWGQTCTRTPTFMQLIKMCGEREGERGRKKYRERERGSIWPGSVWEVRDESGGYLSYRGRFAV